MGGDTAGLSRRALGVCVALAVALWAASALSSLWWGFGRDQAIFAWVGHVIIEGGAPYKDAWEQKGPGTHLVYAAAEAALGPGLGSIRVLDAVLTAVALAAASALAARRLGWLAALVGSVSFALAYLGGGYWYTAQPDGWIALAQLVVLGMIFGLRGSAALERGPAFAAGLLLGAGATLKPQFALAWLALLPVLVGGERLLSRRVLERGAASLVGFALPSLALALWLGALGALGALVEVVLRYNARSHVGFSLSPGFQLQRWAEMLVGVAPIAVCAAAGALLLARRQPAAWASAAILLAVDVVAVVLGKWYFRYHFLPVVAVLCALAAVAVHAAFTSPTAPRAAATCGVLVAASLLQLGWPVAREFGRWVDARTGRSSAEAYEAGFGSPGEGFAEPTSLRTGAWLRAHAQPADCALVWTFDPLPLFASGVPSCTRFGFNLPLVASHSTERERLRAELLSDLRAHPPAFVIVGGNDAHDMAVGTSEQQLAEFETLHAWLDAGYALAERVDHYAIYARR